MKTSYRVTVAAIALGLSGCSMGPKLPVVISRPIEIDTGATGPRYLQHGEAIDPADMNNQLAKEPEAAGYVNGALGMRVVGLLMAAAGGGMIGWPVGQKIGGSPDPNWALAGGGAALATTGLVLSVVSVLILDRAVHEHNRTLPAATAWPIVLTRGPTARVPGAITAAFTLGSSVAVAEGRCAEAGLTWGTSADGRLSCSGVPVDLGTPVTATVTVCGGVVCEVALDAGPDGAAWSVLTQRFAKLALLLEGVHGEQRRRETAPLEDCDQVIQRCFPAGRARTSTTWALPANQSVSLTLDGGPLGGAPSLRLVYRTGAPSGPVR